MLKRKILMSIAVSLLAIIILTACGNQPFDNDTIAPSSKIEDVVVSSNPTEQTIETHTADWLMETHDRIWDEDVHKDFLFYLCYENSEGEIPPVGTEISGREALVVRVDLNHYEVFNNELELTTSVNLNDLDSYDIITLDIPAEQLVQQIAVDDDGMIHIMAVHNIEKSMWAENIGVFWHQIDEGGKIIRTVAAPEAILERPRKILHDFKIGADGNAYLTISTNFDDLHGNYYEVFVINPAGEMLFNVSHWSPLTYMFKDAQGAVYIRHSSGNRSDRDSWYNAVSKIDVTAGILEEIDISEYVNSRSVANGLYINADGSLFLASGSGVYNVEFETKTKTSRFKFAGTGIRLGYEGVVYPLSNERILVAGRGDGARDDAGPVAYSIVRLKTAAELQTETEKTAEGEITVSFIGMSGAEVVMTAIDEFNRINPNSRILFKQYGTYSEDQGEGIQQLNIDIIRGITPDILFIHPDMPYGAYTAKGVFQDLNPYLEADSNFNMADYRENIIRAYEIGNRLYGIPLSFRIDTLFGKASELDNMKSWTMDEFIAFANRYPDSMIFRYPFKTDVLDICLKANGGNMVDWASDGLGFDRDLLIKILKFANRFADAEQYTDARLVLDRIDSGDIHLMEGFAGPDLQMQMAMFGEPVSPIGYPSESGNGYLIYSYLVVALSSKCENSGLAWQFIRYLLSDEFQDKRLLPVRRDSINEHIASAKEGDDSFYGFGDQDGLYFEYQRPGASDEEIDLFHYLLDTTNEIRIFDKQVDSIIKEEAGMFFSGSKTAQMVADIIESRLWIYVMELK